MWWPAPTTPADNAKVKLGLYECLDQLEWHRNFRFFCLHQNGSWANSPVYQSPFLLSVQATPTIGAVVMSREGSVTSLSWLASLKGFVAEGTTNLVLSNWQTITNQPIQIGGQMVLSNSWTDSNRFFRLRASNLP